MMHLDMTHVQYATFARIFDAIIDAPEGLASVTIHSSLAGAALREWAVARKLDVVPSVLQVSEPGRRWTATCLQVTLPGRSSSSIAVHLQDRLYFAEAA
jgi:hypothetical protein